MAHQFLRTTLTDAVLREQETYYGRAQKVPPQTGPDELGAQEEVFIQRRDSFYVASVNAEVLAAKDHPALAAELALADVPARLVERLFRIRVIGYDWNCPKYITPRFTAEEVEQAAAPFKRRIVELEATLAAAKATPSAG